MNNNIRAAGVPRNKELYVLTNYLKDNALSSLIKYQKDTAEDERNVDDFFRLLLNWDNTELSKNSVRNKLMNLKQTGGFDEFL